MHGHRIMNFDNIVKSLNIRVVQPRSCSTDGFDFFPFTLQVNLFLKMLEYM